MKDLERLLGLLESMEIDVPPGELGRALPGPLAPLEGALLAGRYRVRSLLGVGGMGKVLLASDEQVGRLVTLKMLRDLQTDEALARLRREAIVAARLNHPNVVRVHELVETAGQVFVVAEYVEDARDLDQAWQGQPRGARLELLLQVAEGLAAAHAAGVVHRDVKPENVLVDATNRARVSDFGIAGCRDLERLTQTGEIMGSPMTMAPEQALGVRADARADVWALGVLLYLALYEELPFEGQSLAELLNRIGQSEPDYPSQLRVPNALRKVCARALRKDPTRRYPDASAFAAALRAGIDAKPAPWFLRGGLLLLALALAWLWVPAKTPGPAPSPSPSATRGLSRAPQSGTPLRVRLDTPPLRLALSDDSLSVETERGVEVWGFGSPKRRELLVGQRLGPESDPRPGVVPAAPLSLRVQDREGEATLNEGRLELRSSEKSLVLPLPSGLPPAFQELLLTSTSLILVCGAKSNGCRVLVWDRRSGAPLPLAGSEETYLTPRAAAVSPSGARLAVGGQAGLLVIFQLDRPAQPPQVLTDPTFGTLAPRAHDFDEVIRGLTFPTDGELLSADGVSLALWSLPSGAIQDRSRISCYELASRGGRVAFGGPQDVLVQPWAGRLPRRLR